MAEEEFSEVVIEGRKVKVRSASLPALAPYGPTRVIGQSFPRIDAMEKVTGRAVYPTDVVLPNMAHARFVRSSRTHARILSVDTAAAQRVPGVLAIVAPDEFSGVFLKDILGRPLPILTGEPKYFGEEILVVCAETEDAARTAAGRLSVSDAPGAGVPDAGRIKVEYEDMPHSIDPEEQVRAGRYVGGGWTPTPLGAGPSVYERGNVQKAFAGRVRIFERTYRTSPTVHCSIEPHAAVAAYENGQWTVWESTQGVFAVRSDLAELLGVPIQKIRVIGPYPGGGFGSKVAAGKYTFLAAYLSKKLGRPVRCVQDRSEEFVSPYGRPASIQKLKIGVGSDGRLEAIEQIGIHAVGPYEFGAEWGHAEDMLAQMYACKNVRTESYAALTNTPPPCAMRAPGHAQGAFALEQMMDEIARSIHMDPIEFRLKNIPARDPESGHPFAAPRGVHGLAECLKKGAEVFQWTRKKNEKQAASAVAAQVASDTGAEPPLVTGSQTRRGIGVAATVWSGGGGTPATALIRIHVDGTAELFTGAADIGTGTRTVLAQVAAEELGLRTEDVRVTNADTQLTFYAQPSYGSLTLASNGPAVRRAAHACRQQLAALAAGVLETEEKNIVFLSGRAVRPASSRMPEDAVTIAKLVALAPQREILGMGEREANPAKRSLKSYGVQFVAVDVDIETGKIAVAELVAVNDSGRIVNRLTFEGQQIGGATMGLGMAMFEERVYDRETGRPLNPNLADYKIPTIYDQPEFFQTAGVEVPYDGNVLGSKGLGEPPIIPTAAAVANAVHDALGVRMAHLPLSPKRVLDALYPA